MRYELFLRSATPLEASLIAELQAAHPDLQVDPYRDEADMLMGVDLGADLEDPAAPRLLLKATFPLAVEHGLRLYDPQLGRPITDADREMVTEQIERTVAFMQSMPVSTAGQHVGGEQEGMTATTRLWLMIGGAMALALLLTQGLTCMFSG